MQKQDSPLQELILMYGKASIIPRSMKMAMKKEIRMVLQEKFMPIACHRNRKENGCVMWSPQMKMEKLFTVISGIIITVKPIVWVIRHQSGSNVTMMKGVTEKKEMVKQKIAIVKKKMSV